FTLQDGFRLSLAADKGKLVVVYFCTDAAQADCVREARGVRDRWNDLFRNHVVVVGVTPQSVAAHRALIAHENLPFDLASDVDGHLAEAFKATATPGAFGPRVIVIGRDGTVRRTWQTADPERHIQEILRLAQTPST
ncbi:MAG TPA: redoxin domain-containing protein, partial [Polyangia bacterium]|nr:redoxin domain-containing protein [Polyangia bacterium]